MNVARGTPFLLDAFFVELDDLCVFDVVGDVGVAVLRAGIDVENFFRCGGAGKFGEQFVGACEPRADCQVAAT